MSFSVCSSGPLCDFPRLSAARLMLSRAFSSTVTFRGSSFYGFAASLCSSLRLSRFFAVTRQGFQVLATLRHNIPELYIPRYGSSLLAFLKLSWLSRALPLFTVTFRGSPFYGFAASLCSSLRLSRFFAVTFHGFAASLCSSLRLSRFFAVTFHGFAASLCSSLRLFRFFAVTRQGFQVLATLRHNIPELYIPRYGSSLLAFLKLSWLSRASIANCKNTT